MITTVAMLIFAATGPVEPGPYAAPWDGQSYRQYKDTAAGISFAIPLSGFLLESRHFDPALPVEKVKHLLTLSGVDGAEVTIDVWVDPKKSDVWSFFEK